MARIRRRGYVSVELGDEVRKLKFDCNALALAEERLGQPITQILMGGNVGVRAIRECLYAGLSHEGPHVTPERVGAQMEIGQLGYYANCISDALKTALGVRDDEAETDDDEGEAGALETES